MSGARNMLFRTFVREFFGIEKIPDIPRRNKHIVAFRDFEIKLDGFWDGMPVFVETVHTRELSSEEKEVFIDAVSRALIHWYGYFVNDDTLAAFANSVSITCDGRKPLRPHTRREMPKAQLEEIYARVKEQTNMPFTDVDELKRRGLYV